MAASVYPSTQWGTTRRLDAVGRFAASDIVLGAAVRIASSGDSTVQMCQSSAEKPIGVAADYAAAGKAVAIYTEPNESRMNIGGQGAGASFSRQSYIGIVGTSSMVHPQTGVTVTYGVIGQVTGTPSVAVGASTAAVWAVGVALESAAIGDFAAFAIEPRLLSGLVTS